MKRIHLILLLATLIPALGCKKYVDTPVPASELVSGLAFTEDKTATAAVTGIYSTMNSFNYFFSNVLMNYLPAMAADDLYYFTTFANFDVFKNNSLLPEHQYVETLWSEPYSYIYSANACLEGLKASTKLTPAVKDQLMGEAYFVRAFFHFNLVNLYGHVPYVTSIDYTVSGKQLQDPASVVYDGIIKDLTEAKKLLKNEYPNTARTRPNKGAATALLARTYLYIKQWNLAEKEASEIIGNSQYELLDDLTKVFLANSKEAIWQLQPVNVGGGRNTWEGFTSTPATPTGTPLFRLNTTLVNSFEANDLRMANWVGFRDPVAGRIWFPWKYKVRTSTAGVTEFSMVFRTAEQYLIRAEAYAQQNKLDEARKDLDSIRVRAGLLPLPTNLDKGALLLAVEKERRVELFCEWGHRWFDLKRTGRANDVLGALKPGLWEATDTILPIPTVVMSRTKGFDQNDGYE